MSPSPIYFNFDENNFTTVSTTRKGGTPEGIISRSGDPVETKLFDFSFLRETRYAAFSPTQSRTWVGSYDERQGEIIEIPLSNYDNGVNYRKILERYFFRSSGTIPYSLVTEGQMRWFVNDQTVIGINRLEVVKNEIHLLTSSYQNIFYQIEVRDTIDGGTCLPFFIVTMSLSIPHPFIGEPSILVMLD